MLRFERRIETIEKRKGDNMRSYERPNFESQRDREQGYRERDSSSAQRRYRSGRRDDDDDRGPWISSDRDRDPFESEFDPRDREYRERGRFEQLEDWERPREFGQQRRRSSFGSGEGYGRAGRGGAGYGRDAGYRDDSRSWGGDPSSFGQAERTGYGSSFEQEGQRGRHAGRGPKGYQRSDERLKEEVCERLTAHADIDASEIEVSVQNGEVTLEGTVENRQMKRAAEDCAEAVSGAQQVHNRLRVQSNQESGRDEGRFASSNDEGQRSSAGRKAH
jgi:hypothetical protein